MQLKFYDLHRTSGNAGLMGGYTQRQLNTEGWGESLKKFLSVRPVMNKLAILKYHIHIYVFMYIYIYIYIYIYTDTHTHPHIYRYTYILKYTCV